MNVGRVCTREVVFVDESESLHTAAELMRNKWVGSVVVCKEVDSQRVPVGMITDRDVAMAALRSEGRLSGILASQAMSRNPLVIPQDEDVADALERMRSHGVRRAPVVNTGGALVGLVSIDDLLEVLVEQLSSIVHLIARQLKPSPKLPGGRMPPA
ncbi:MAG TPA: CBS domain-containing protein [Steroidobacter sp.]|uniref:CBS domain-containing protein n=1 Tax=Steroidobacter sp. TaxID=1978227 RepID=UPI002ED88E44